MAPINAPILGFQGGILGKYLEARVDVGSYARSAAIMENFRPYAQGPMGRRPPLEYIDTLPDDDKTGTMFPFVFDTDQSYLIVAHDDDLRFYIQDGIVTTLAVTAAISNGSFATGNDDLADAATITPSSTNSGSMANLVDEDVTTNWQSNNDSTATLTIDLLSAKTLLDIWLTSDDVTNNRAPLAFTLDGSATGSFSGEETNVLTVSGEANWSASERRKYEITSPGSYRYYQLSMTNSQSGTGNYSLSEISLFDSVWKDLSTGASAITITGGQLFLDSDGGTFSRAEQAVTINETSTNHILAFTVVHGPVSMQIGTSSGASDIVEVVDLRKGYHQILFDPDGNSSVYLQFNHSANAGRIVDDVSILAGGSDYTIPHPYAETELVEIEYQQIGDVLYLSHSNHETRRLERRGHRSWSLTYNHTTNGPFGATNTTPTTISSSNTSGETVLTASDDLFVSGDSGALYALTDSGQIKTAAGAAQDVATDGVKITGSTGAARTFNIQVTGTFSGTVRLQESSGNENNYVDTAETYTTTANVNYDDNKDNETWYYRLIIEAYTSGSITMTLTYTGGASTGIARVIEITNATTATAEILEPIPSTDAISTWKRSPWSDAAGWPAAVTNGFGRAWYGRDITLWASKSDDFTNFDEGSEADQAFSVTLAQESSEGVLWLDFLGRIVIGSRTRETIGLGNTTSEPVGPTNFQTVPASEEGSARIRPVRAEGTVLYVHRSRRKLMQFTQSPQALSQDSFTSIDLTELAPEVLDDEVVRIAIQREPQRRVFAVLRSGKLAELLFRREIEVTAWDIVKTNGRVEDVMVIQQDSEDHVYFVIRRKIGGTWKRFIERFGHEAERVHTDPQLYHLDSALTRDLERPDTLIESSGITGTVTLTADDAVFDADDIGKRIWLAGGRGLVTAQPSTSEVTVDLTTDLDEIDGTSPVPSGRWGMATEITAVSGLDHLEGETVRVYADQKDHGTFTVASGAITLGQSASIIHAGLSFSSRYRSLKLAYGAQKGTALGMKKSIKQLIAILHRTGQSITHGRMFTKMNATIKTRREENWDEPVPLFTGEKNGLSYDTGLETDPRLHIVVDGPEPATVVGFVPSIGTNDV